MSYSISSNGIISYGGADDSINTHVLSHKYFCSQALIGSNLGIVFYAAFGIPFKVTYTPFPLLFLSSYKMNELAANVSDYVRNNVSSAKWIVSWMVEMALIFYACLFTRRVEPLAEAITRRLYLDRNWETPLMLIGAVFESVDLAEFNIRTIRLLLRGRVEGRERAGTFLREWGESPTPIRNGRLLGSYAEMQCVSRYGISHVHLWFTWF